MVVGSGRQEGTVLVCAEVYIVKRTCVCVCVCVCVSMQTEYLGHLETSGEEWTRCPPVE